MSEDQGEISSLKRTLRTQQKLVHELYRELEAEREASSTAANEALSMILRLQREKAADKLEAIQFKRMTQEDLNHAHQIILLFQETLRHKDMFIASLDLQLQAYRNQMLAMGLTDSQIRDLELAHPPLFPLPPQDNGEDVDLHTIFDEESAPSPSYLEQIQHLDTRVRRGLSPAQVIEEEFTPISSTHSTDHFDDANLPCSSGPENLSHTSFPCSETEYTAIIHDVFEVPQAALQEDNRLRNPDPIPHGSGTTSRDDETGWSKSSQKSAPDDIKRSKPSVDCHLALTDLANGIFPFQNDLHRLKRRLAGQRGSSGNEEDELSLLTEIHEKLSTIQSEMRSRRANHPVMDESSLISLMEEHVFGLQSIFLLLCQSLLQQ